VAIKKSSEKDITAVSLKDSDDKLIWIEAVEIDSNKKHALITVAVDTDLTGITPELILSPGARLIDEIPEAGLDFKQNHPFTIEAQDGSRQTWTVAIKKSSEKDITGVISLTKGDDPITILSSFIDKEAKEVLITVPRNTDLSAVTPVLEFSLKAELKPAIPEAGLDFTQPVTLTVKAQDGTLQKWTVKIVYDTSSIIGLNVELAGTYDIKFGFSYPNYKKSGSAEPDYTPYKYAYKAGDPPIKLSYFVTDNSIYDGATRKTYYITLVVDAPGFTNVTWRIDGRAAPTNNSTEDTDPPANKILTIRAQDRTLENTHTVAFVGTLNGIKYSGTFEFKVVEIEEAAE
jgi:hypothetical protein